VALSSNRRNESFSLLIMEGALSSRRRNGSPIAIVIVVKWPYHPIGGMDLFLFLLWR